MTRRGRWLRSIPSIRAVALIVLLGFWPSLQAGSATHAEAGPVRHQLQAMEERAARLERRIVLMERSVRRFHHWMGCISLVPVDEVGDRDHRFGFAYNEGDGTGLDHRPALVIGSRSRRSDYHFLRFAMRDNCQSHPTRPGTPASPGTADPARTTSRDTVATRLRRLERLVFDLERRVPSLDRMSNRFDEWESCLTMVGVTEYGDPDGGFGYLFEIPNGSGFMPALAVDISEWDDPDYFFLAFKGRNRPFVKRECTDEDGEEVDRAARALSPAPAREAASSERPSNLEDRLLDVRQEMDSLREDVEDLWKAVGEFEIFDQCMYTIGVSEFGSPVDGTGYVYAHAHRFIRPALAMDVASFRMPAFQFLAYPGEEPPSIECNEDADPRPPNSQ
jgi:hypothetical protein